MPKIVLQWLRYVLACVCVLTVIFLIDEKTRYSPGLLLFLILSGGGAVIAHDKLRNIRKREKYQQDEAIRQKEETERKARDASLGQLLHLQAKLNRAFAAAQKLAQADYPDHFDAVTLLDRDWDDEHIPLYLDPPDIVLKFDVPDDPRPGSCELRLYARDRVLDLEASNYEVREAISHNLGERLADEADERREEERRQKEANELAERERRVAQQRIINITDKLI